MAVNEFGNVDPHIGVRAFALSPPERLHSQYTRGRLPRTGVGALLQGLIQKFTKGSVPPVPFLFPSPLELWSLKPARGSGERCKLPQWGPWLSPGRKRIWRTLKLSDSH